MLSAGNANGLITSTVDDGMLNADATTFAQAGVAKNPSAIVNFGQADAIAHFGWHRLTVA